MQNKITHFLSPEASAKEELILRSFSEGGLILRSFSEGGAHLLTTHTLNTHGEGLVKFFTEDNEKITGFFADKLFLSVYLTIKTPYYEQRHHFC